MVPWGPGLRSDLVLEWEGFKAARAALSGTASPAGARDQATTYQRDVVSLQQQLGGFLAAGNLKVSRHLSICRLAAEYVKHSVPSSCKRPGNDVSALCCRRACFFMRDATQEDDILRNWDAMLQTLRGCNACLRWLLCHALPGTDASAGSLPRCAAMRLLCLLAQGCCARMAWLKLRLCHWGCVVYQQPMSFLCSIIYSGKAHCQLCCAILQQAQRQPVSHTCSALSAGH